MTKVGSGPTSQHEQYQKQKLNIDVHVSYATY